MRIRRLYIDGYRVLRELELDFESVGEAGPEALRSSYGMSFLVGRNGSGKSTLLRLIADIVLKVESGASIEYAFDFEYELAREGGSEIVRLVNFDLVDGEAPRVGPTRAEVDGAEVPVARRLLPSRVIAFTTGAEADWQGGGAITADSPLDELDAAEAWRREVPARHASEGHQAPFYLDSNVFRLVPKRALPLVTICGALADVHFGEDSRLGEVFDEVGIRRVAGFSLRLTASEETLSQAEQRLTDELARAASRVVRSGHELLLVYDLTDDASEPARRVVEVAGTPLALFETLHELAEQSATRPAVLNEVSVFVEPKADGETRRDLHLLEWLSDGERSFLGRICLFLLAADDGSLILLDEPEVHFNDYWKRQIGQVLDRVLSGKRSHVLIATHSSIALTDVPRDSVFVLTRSNGYTRAVTVPPIQTLAADPSDIIVHVFGAPHSAGEHAVRQVESALREPSNAQQRERLQELADALAPGYWRYRIMQLLAAPDDPSG